MTSAAGRLLELAARGRLYPSVILHGGDEVERLELAHRIGRALLCEQAPGERPCGVCRHCRRIAREHSERKPQDKKKVVHPDFQVIFRDHRGEGKEKTVISVESMRALVRAARVSPFEARGQVFVVAEAERLREDATDALLKTLEEPATGSPRNFVLLTPWAYDLAPTLRSRSLVVYLGANPAADAELTAELLELWRELRGQGATGPWVAALAERMVAGGGFDDIRDRRGFTRAAAALKDAAPGIVDRRDRLAALALAADLLDAHWLRQRVVPPHRIIEGLAVRRLGGDWPATDFETSVVALLGSP